MHGDDENWIVFFVLSMGRGSLLSGNSPDVEVSWIGSPGNENEMVWGPERNGNVFVDRLLVECRFVSMSVWFSRNRSFGGIRETTVCCF